MKPQRKHCPIIIYFVFWIHDFRISREHFENKDVIDYYWNKKLFYGIMLQKCIILFKYLDFYRKVQYQ